jgi:hypothetical protein
MSVKAEFVPRSPGNNAVDAGILVYARLKRLRRERRLVERAILALTAISRTRRSRARRAAGT